MKRFLTSLATFLLVATVGFPALASSLMLLGVGGTGGGSTGWVTTGGSTNFSITNNAKGSSSFNNSSYWTPTNSGAALSVNSTPVADPNGGTTAWQVTFPAVSGSTSYSVLQQNPLLSDYAFTFGVWAQVVSGASNGSLWISASIYPNFKRAVIPSDGAWHLVVATVPPATLVGSTLLQIGVNGYDSGQAATTGPIVVNLWGAHAITPQYEPYITPAMLAGPLATTSTTVAGTVSIPLPSYTRTGGGTGTLAWRSFASLTPYSGNPNINRNPAQIWNNGGISNPYINAPLNSGGYMWGFANCTSSADEGDWMSLCLYKSTDALNWTEDTTNAPYLQTYGSVFAAPTVTGSMTGYSGSGTMTWTGANCTTPLTLSVTTSGGAIATATRTAGACNTWPSGVVTTWTCSGGLTCGTGASFAFADVKGTGTLSWWELHPAWLPYGCNIPSGAPYGAGAHNFCILLGGKNPGATAWATFLAFADTVDGVYTLYGCPAAGTCAAPTAVLPSTSIPTAPPTIVNNELPAVLNVGGINGINYVYTNDAGESATYQNIWTTPANPATTGAGSSLTWYLSSLQPVIPTDWDYAAGEIYQDPQVIQNSCGFYEYFYTASNFSGGGVPNSNGKEQSIGYAIGPTPIGPWWKFNGPIIPGTSSMYFGTPFIGDSSPIVIGGQFIWMGNYDSGTISPGSASVAATEPDVTGCP